jgi:hypothetical protein
MATEKKKTVSDKKNVTKKPIELDERDLQKVTGGTGSGVVEDPCAGGRARNR